MLNSSTKSVAWEVVSTLVKPSERGTLQILEDILSTEFGRNGAEDGSPEETSFKATQPATRTHSSPYKQDQYQQNRRSSSSKPHFPPFKDDKTSQPSAQKSSKYGQSRAGKSPAANHSINSYTRAKTDKLANPYLNK